MSVDMTTGGPDFKILDLDDVVAILDLLSFMDPDVEGCW